MSGKTQKNGTAKSGTLLTGFPSNELACRVLARLLEAEPTARVICLVPARFAEAAEAWLATRSEQERGRVEQIEGDVAAIDMGLSGAEYRDLMARVRRIHHCAAVTYSGAPLEMAEQVNVGGTHEVLELGVLPSDSSASCIGRRSRRTATYAGRSRNPSWSSQVRLA